MIIPVEKNKALKVTLPPKGPGKHPRGFTGEGFVLSNLIGLLVPGVMNDTHEIAAGRIVA